MYIQIIMVRLVLTNLGLDILQLAMAMKLLAVEDLKESLRKAKLKLLMVVLRIMRDRELEPRFVDN